MVEHTQMNDNTHVLFLVSIPVMRLLIDVINNLICLSSDPMLFCLTFCLYGTVNPKVFLHWFQQYFKHVSSDAFSLVLFFLPFFSTMVSPYTSIIVTGDQSPSSPASRWPGANYGNRTLGVCVFLSNCLFNPIVTS